MNPIAFEVFGIQVRWYGIFIALGMFIAAMLLKKFMKEKGYPEDTVYEFLLVILPAAIVGARLYYVIFNWSHYSGDLLRIINLREGGLAIHGGVIGGVIAGYIYCKIKNLKFLEMADFVAPGLVLAQAIGRWGNYANQEAHGGPTDLPWAIDVGGVGVHPTFLYESIWNVLIFIFLMWFRKKKPFNGALFILYAMLYSVGRFFIESLRTDSLMIGPLRQAQVISVVIFLGGLILYGYLLKKERIKKESKKSKRK